MLGTVDLVNYSELHHPMSHHNVAIGNTRVNVLPTDLSQAGAAAELVQKGFYSKTALELKNAYPSEVDKTRDLGV